jgi:hypothetical protein
MGKTDNLFGTRVRPTYTLNAIGLTAVNNTISTISVCILDTIVTTIIALVVLGFDKVYYFKFQSG